MPRLLLTTAVASLLATAAWGADTPSADPPQAKPYTLDTCIVSGEKLGGMGEAVVVVRDGREIKFCCKGCIKTFDKDPATFIKKIDAAEKAKADTKAATMPGTDYAAHQH
jgi:YHS domain-containing protein